MKARFDRMWRVSSFVSLGRIALLLISFPAAFSQDHLVRISKTETVGDPHAVAVGGHYAYLAEPIVVGSGPIAGIGYFTVYDVADAVTPQLVATIELTNPATGIALYRDHIYLGVRDEGLYVYDVGDPASPALVAHRPFSGGIREIKIAGTRLFVSNEAAGVRIYDISDPADPDPVAVIDTPGLAYGAAVNGELLYVADIGSLRIYDLTNPAAPIERSHLTITGGNVRDVTYAGPIAFVAVDLAGIAAVDVSDPDAPMRVATVDTPGKATDLQFYDSVLFNADQWGGLQVYAYDFNAATFQTVASHPSTDGSRATHMALDGDTIYLASNDVGGFKIFRRTPPAQAQLSLVTKVSSTTGDPADLALIGHYLYVAEFVKDGGAVRPGIGYIEIFDVTDPATPVLIETLTFPGAVRSMFVRDSLLYFGVFGSGLRIYDAGNPASPSPLGSVSIPGDLQDVFLEGNRAYLANGSGGVRIVDVSDPRQPEMVGGFNTSGTAWGVFSRDAVLYVANKSDLRVYNVLDPQQPELLTRIARPGGWARDIVFGKRTAYLANDAMGIDVLDISDLEDPRLVRTVSAPGRSTNVSLSGRYLVNCGQLGGVSIFDVSIPDQPQRFASFSVVSPERSGNAVLAMPYVYVTADVAGFQVLRLSQTVPGGVVLLSPNGNERFPGDSLIPVHWRLDVASAGTAVGIELYQGGHFIDHLGVDWSPDGENRREVYLPLLPEADDYRMRVVSLWDPTLFDESNAPFAVTGGAVRVHAPNGGETWPAGSLQWIHWQANTDFAGSAVALELWNAGVKVADLGTSWDPDGEGALIVVVPDVAAGEEYRVRAISLWDGQHQDFSDSPMTILNPGGPVGEGGSGDGRNAIPPGQWILYR
jgi:hypothetical protein